MAVHTTTVELDAENEQLRIVRVDPATGSSILARGSIVLSLNGTYGVLGSDGTYHHIRLREVCDQDGKTRIVFCSEGYDVP